MSFDGFFSELEEASYFDLFVSESVDEMELFWLERPESVEAAVLRSLVRLSEAAIVLEAAFRRPIAPPPLASVEELKSSSVSLDIVEDTFKIMAILAQVLR